METEIATLEERKKQIEMLLSDAEADPDAISKAAVEFGKISDQIDEKTMRWLELSEKTG